METRSRHAAFVSGTILLSLAPFTLTSCSSLPPNNEDSALPPYGEVLRKVEFSDQLEKQILGLDPEAVSDADVREILAHAPAPRIFLIQGGLPIAVPMMRSFGKFLVEMGYPRDCVENPRNQTLSYSSYLSGAEMAGYVAWYYEHSGMRPMIIGHSQGGMQTVRILHELNGTFSHDLTVWNPDTGKSAGRQQITDPLQATHRPLVGLQVSYASALAAGGLARLNPSHLNLNGLLRTIPDTVEDFEGFHIHLDFIGGDLFGYGSMNDYEPTGSASVKNVSLPWNTLHVQAPNAHKLAENPESRDWINRYQPGVPIDRQKPPSDSGNIIFAAEAWHSIKRHWVLELRRLIEARKKLAVN